ncbi:MAG: nuclease-related domain-containing protein [Gemmatimonadaceae bacterium]
MFGSKKKLPLPAVRRLAGQSLREEKERLTDNRLIPFYFSAASFWALWASEYLHAQWNLPMQPTVFLGLAIVATGVCAIVFGRVFHQFGRLNRGERGELKVAEALEELRPAGYRAFHDIVRDGFNIDHVLVGPAGVFAIETKFRSGRGEITFRNG